MGQVFQCDVSLPCHATCTVAKAGSSANDTCYVPQYRSGQSRFIIYTLNLNAYHSSIFRTVPASPTFSMLSALFWESPICKLYVQGCAPRLTVLRTQAKLNPDLFLKQVRAANLQDLIYKRGQAGITKASVTIVFDNSDREKSPVGFETYKQVTVTRQVGQMNGLKPSFLLPRRALIAVNSCRSRWVESRNT